MGRELLFLQCLALAWYIGILVYTSGMFALMICGYDKLCSSPRLILMLIILSSMTVVDPW